MRHFLTGLGVMIGLGTFATPSQAQINSGFSDPFFLYYGYYLPSQAAYRAQPQPEDNIRARAAGAQVQAQAERSALYEPQAFFADADLDPSRPFGPDKRGRSRLPRTTPSGIVSGNLTGTGPAGYYNRTGNFYPTIKTGRARNASAGGGAMSFGGRGGGGPQPIGLPNATQGMGFPG